MTRLRGRREGGLTLIEVLAALVILTVAVLTLFGLQNDAIVRAGRARDMRTARLLASSRMGEVLLREELEEGSDEGEFEEHPGFSWQEEITAVEIQVEDIEEEEDPPQALKITVRVIAPGVKDPVESTTMVPYLGEE